MPTLAAQTLKIKQGEDKTLVIPILEGGAPVSVLGAVQIIAALKVGGR